jgi:hypothetical protein
MAMEENDSEDSAQRVPRQAEPFDGDEPITYILTFRGTEYELTAYPPEARDEGWEIEVSYPPGMSIEKWLWCGDEYPTPEEAIGAGKAVLPTLHESDLFYPAPKSEFE